MSTHLEKFIAFVRQRQKELDLGQNELARASGLSQATLANVLGGRVTRAPSLVTIQKLAHGLRLDPERLVALALNKESRPGRVVERPAAMLNHDLTGRGEYATRSLSGEAYPLTEEEQAIIESAEKAGVYWHINGQCELLRLSPEERKYLFWNFACFVHAIELHRHLNHM
ncbi:MAG: helix-turn-helix transcriptional regulator [Cyanobacteria bacterium NC_groundwater_1444_Ag_S-0.65um_54_12]|nr:helix-turn-helix transcriptional regulator [Cyanobacteria bacterium NC_groundwater_1444_Ag_S-0.65um_54_12]